MRFHYQIDDISLSPLKKDLAGYSFATLRQDFYAGAHVALLTVPQAMAYSLLAGLPLYCGLFAAIYSAIVCAIFGSSRHLVVGPSNAIAILIQSGTSDILFTYYRDLSGPEKDLMVFQILTQLCLFIGIIQVLAAGCKLGRLTHFVSHSVVVGYIAGTLIAVVVNQFFPFSGLIPPPGSHSLYENGLYYITHVHLLHWQTLLIGLTSMTVMFLLKRIDKRIPAAVIAFVLMGVIVQVLDLATFTVDDGITIAAGSVQKVMLVGDVSSHFDVIPLLDIPYFNTTVINHLLPVAFAIALLSSMETISVAKSIAANSGQRLSLNQEIFGIGVGNLLSAFTGGMPVSGSPSRSALNYANGAKTRFASIINALIVGVILYSFGYLVSLIPIACLAALLLFNSSNIVNARQFFLCLKATGSDAFVLWATLLSCVFFSLDIAFYIGTALSITLYLKKAAIPQLAEYDIDEAGELKSIDFSSKKLPCKPIRVIKVEGELFFGAADLFQNTLKTIAEDDTNTRVIILQLKNARDIDATGCLAIQQLYEYLKNSKRHLLLSGLTFQIWEVLSDSGIIELVGKENLFIFDDRHPHHYLQKALQRAKTLTAFETNQPGATTPLPLAEEKLVIS